MGAAIETDHLSKRYGDVTAVDGLSLHVARGEIYAFLALNGAGNRKPWRSMGYLVETADAYPELTVRENLDAMRHLRPGTEPKAVDGVIERLGLTTYAHRRAGTLSHGSAQRLGLAKAMFYDEEYFPWSIPLLASQATVVGPASYVIIILTCVAGIAGTLMWWKLADQTH